MSYPTDSFSFLNELLPDRGKEPDIGHLLLAIEQRVTELIETDPGLLMSYLYRLDIEENAVSKLLNSPETEDRIRKISKLILDRQLQRMKTKKEIKQDPIEGWDW